MRSKSVKCWYPRFASAIALAAALGAWPSVASALTVRPADPYSIDSGNNKVWYFVGSGATLDTPKGFYTLDTSTIGSSTNEIRFVLRSDASGLSVGSGQKLLITASATATTGTSPFLVPIATVDGVDCLDGDNCQGTSYLVNNVQVNPGGGYLYGARYTASQDVTIGIYPKALCEAANSLGSANAFCSGSSVVTVGTGSPASIELTFNLVIADQAATVLPAPSSETVALQVALSLDQPSFSAGNCPAALTDFWFPGDEAIFLNTSAFSAASTSNAPSASTLVIEGVEGSSPPSSLGNTISGRLTIGSGAQELTGFKNTSTAEDHPYALSFTARNTAGVVAPFVGSTCQTNGVRATAIRGFLPDSRCFIATAAYRSSEAGPVLLLRKFRDHVLFNVPGGEDLVRVYYENGPIAAIWLNAHPAFRAPVLLALTPLEAFAWVLLHRGVALGLLALALALVTYSLMCRHRMGRDQLEMTR